MTNEEAIIDLNALKFILDNDQYTDEIEEALDTAISALQQPEVMTCRECYHYPNEFADCPLIGWPRNENDYCSKAERRSDGVDS